MRSRGYLGVRPRCRTWRSTAQFNDPAPNASFKWLGGVTRKTLRKTLPTERGDLGGIGIKSRFRGLERRRAPMSPVARPTPARVVGEGHPNMRVVVRKLHLIYPVVANSRAAPAPWCEHGRPEAHLAGGVCLAPPS
jgi:hypothetical protein